MAALVAAAAAVAMGAAMDIPMGTCESFFVLHAEGALGRLLLRLQPCFEDAMRSERRLVLSST